jgi:hypothetical protein
LVSWRAQGTTLYFIVNETFEMKRNDIKKEERERKKEWSEAERVFFSLYVVDKAPNHKDVCGSVGKTPLFFPQL